MNKELKAGDIIEGVQLAPFGTYPAITTNGKRVDQVCDRKAYVQVVEAFNAAGKEVRVDIDHKSETTDTTEAAGWIVNCRVDDTRGLVGDIKVSGRGARVLNDLDYRFASPAFALDELDRPAKLLSLALTNRPNMADIEKVYNAAPADPAPELNTDEATRPKETLNNMDLQIKQALGLPEDATDEVTLNAVQELTGKLKEYTDKEKAAEVAAAVADLPEDCREGFTRLYADNPEAVKSVINSVVAHLAKPAEPEKPKVEAPKTVCNAAEAQKPDLAAAWATYNALPQRDKLAYAKAHKAELV